MDGIAKLFAKPSRRLPALATKGGRALPFDGAPYSSFVKRPAIIRDLEIPQRTWGKVHRGLFQALKASRNTWSLEGRKFLVG
jgi:hypothetical protein